MLYVQLDCNWPDHHKIIDAGVEGAGAHAIVMCLAKRLERDGWVRRSVLARYGVTDALVDRLLELELLEAEDVQVRPWDWHDRNPSQAAIAAIRASKVEAGKKGNHDRWAHPFPFDTCPKCHPVAGCDPVGSDPYRTPTKSKLEVPIAIAASDRIDPVQVDQLRSVRASYRTKETA